MHAERKALRGERGDRGLRGRRSPGAPSSSRRRPGRRHRTDRRTPPDHRPPACGETPPRSRCPAPEPTSRARINDSSSATVRRHRSPSRRPATAPTCGSRAATTARRRRSRGSRTAPPPDRAVAARRQARSRAQRGRLTVTAARRPPRRCRRAGEYGDQQIAALLEGAVHQADRYGQRLRAAERTAAGPGSANASTAAATPGVRARHDRPAGPPRRRAALLPELTWCTGSAARPGVATARR